MLGSQVIKCYELPYCTLEILAQDRFRLFIESLKQGEEPTFQLSSDRAHLPSLAETIQTYWQGVSPPSQQHRQPIYSISLVVDNQSHSLHLNWGQLSDLVKLLGQYQSDIAQNSNLRQKQAIAILPFLALILVVIAGGVMLRSRWHKSHSQTAMNPSAPSSPVTDSASPPSLTTPSTIVPNHRLNKPKLKLSDSLEKLNQLSPPNSVNPPSLNPGEVPPLPSPQPVRDLPKPDSKENFKAPKFPALNNSRKVLKPSPPLPEETLFDQTPQVAEIRQYLQQRWQPPKTLEQDLEYQIMVDPDGSLKQVIPLGTVAQAYLSSLPLPESNQPFVSASTTETQQKIRLVFRRSGEIKTFLID